MRPPLTFVISELNSALLMLEDLTPRNPSKYLIDAKRAINEALNSLTDESIDIATELANDLR